MSGDDGERYGAKGKALRTALLAIAAVILTVVGGYSILPWLIDRRTAPLRSDIEELQKKVQKQEEIFRAGEERWKGARLSPDADARAIIESVNAQAAKVTSLDVSLKKETGALNASLREQDREAAKARKGLAEAIGKLERETGARFKVVTIGILINEARGRLLKAKVDLLAKNAGLAASELDAAVGLLDRLIVLVPPAARLVAEAQQTAIKTAKGEMTTDLAAAVKRVDLIWYELGKLEK